MRFVLLSLALLLLAGCGSSSASAPPTPTPRPQSTSSQSKEPGARWTAAPAMTINPSHTYRAVVKTTDGTFTITLLPKVAPLTVNNFVFLARHHYYDNNPIFRIIATEMFQTGDPTGTGYGGPGYTFKDEKVTRRYTVGTVAMANRGPNTNGSQFFVVTGPDALHLPKAYTIFGKVTSGMSVVNAIANTPVGTSPSGEVSEPLSDINMLSVKIVESK